MIIALDRYIAVTPGVCGGKPRIAGRRIKVAHIASAYLHADRTAEDIAKDYSLSLAEVHAALSFFHDHEAEISDQIAEEEATAEQLRRKNPSLLRAKLKRRGRSYEREIKCAG